jgi:phosphoribosylglycinamide formyltransferase-1
MALPIVVLISGSGSNLAAVLEAIASGRCDAHVRAVISDRTSARGLERARAAGVETRVLRIADFPDREQWNVGLADAVASYQPGLVVSAGFMRVLASSFIERFAGRIINIHPALLPLFPGTDGPAQAVAAGVRVSGCTVHVADAGVDSGPIIAQAVVPVLDGDDADKLHARIQRAEHSLLPAVIHAIARGEIELGARVRVAPRCVDESAMLMSLRT